MKYSKRFSVLVCSLCFSLMLIIPMRSVQAQGVTEDEVYSYIMKLNISFSVKESLTQALQDGFRKGRIQPPRTFHFLQQIHQSGTVIKEREHLFVIIIDAFEKDLPINQIINKTFEGMGKGLELMEINNRLRDWKITITRIKEVLYRHNISLDTEALSSNSNLNLRVMDTLIEDMGISLNQYVLTEGELGNLEAVKAAVIKRLKWDRKIPPQLIGMVDARITPHELGELAAGIKERLKIDRQS